MCVRQPLIATCGMDRSIHLWNYVDRSCELSKAFAEEAYSIAIHPTGLQVRCNCQSTTAESLCGKACMCSLQTHLPVVRYRPCDDRRDQVMLHGTTHGNLSDMHTGHCMCIPAPTPICACKPYVTRSAFVPCLGVFCERPMCCMHEVQCSIGCLWGFTTFYFLDCLAGSSGLRRQTASHERPYG